MVRMSDTAYSVETFQLVRNVGLLRLEGWFVSAAPPAAMNLVVPGSPGLNIGVGDLRRPSSGLVGLYGERARNARFRLEEPIAEAASGLGEARLMVLLQNGDMLSVFVGPLFGEVERLAEPTFGADDQALMMRFESLGDNCEFGLVQRTVGPERIGLLRLAGARNAARLAEAIEREFDGFSMGDDLELSTQGDEWIVSSRRYGFTFHTGVGRDAMSADDILAAQSQTLAFMAQKLMEDIAEGRKVFVRRVNEGGLTDGMAAVYQALRQKGEATLLWVTAATPETPHGLVEHVEGTLFRGYHAELADYATANVFRVTPWLELLRSAERAIALAAAPPPVTVKATSEGERGRDAWWPAPSPGPALRRSWWKRLLGR